MTELVTGLGMLGHDSIEDALRLEPREMVSMSPEVWRELRDLHRGGALRQEFYAAWVNGRAFLQAEDALRGRPPRMVEWKGAVRAPGDEVVPADLRVDHVYLVSCKYLSRIVLNASPPYLFDRLLVGGHGRRSPDWYRTVAPDELQAFYEIVRRLVAPHLQPRVELLTLEDRQELARGLAGRWPKELLPEATRFSQIVAERSASRWRAALDSAGAAERLLWRLLRIGSAPYFVLGTDRSASLRLRIETPWDWKQSHRLVSFDIGTQASEQPVVTWRATVEEVRSATRVDLVGHIEIRWSHGKFKSSPEAKVYLDTPHHQVPGYVPLR